MKDVSYEDEPRAVLARVETDDTSLALDWIASEGGGDEDGAEIVRVSDGSIRRFDRETGMGMKRLDGLRQASRSALREQTQP